MIAADLAVKTFTRLHPQARNVHLMLDNKTALTYLIKMGGTKNKALTEISKSLWDYLLSRETILTTEYLPSKLNIEADYQSRNVTD